ncbi:unnamed protein product [Ceutorhynchus assimilis]|uniref:UBX domain-containing protein n=1 Tax=Ceutorhynchus assimilis TaxID=467358 RepID=A0A9N9QR36_9CUCU|nr:unnamed protein product [Ceutorhynchus assimilis]
MGITGLLPYLAQATRQCHISEFRNGTVAVDSYCLLHKGTNACAEQLARGEDNQILFRSDNMSGASVNVLTLNGRRQTVKCTPNTTILQIIEEVCKKQGLNPIEYDIKHHNKILDTTATFRFSGLPNNAQLELAVAVKNREEGDITLAVNLENGSRVTGIFTPNDTLLNVLNKLCPENSSPDKNPVVIYTRREIYGRELENCTLRSLGLVGGRAMIRVLNRDPKLLHQQANISALLPSKPVEEKPYIRKFQPIDNPSKQQQSVDNPSTQLPNESHKDNNESWYNYGKGNKLGSSEEKSQIQPQKNVKNTTVDILKLAKEKRKSPENQKNPDIKGKKKMTKNVPQKSIEEEFVFCGERNGMIFSLESAHSVPSEELPDDFFDLTIDDAKKILRDVKKKRHELENQVLKTSQLRTLEESKKQLRNLNKYKRAIIRVQFPDRTVVQGTFKPTETVRDVLDFVKGYLEDQNIDFYIYSTPPKAILQKESRLIEIGCVPGALLYFGTNLEQKDDFLKKELQNMFTTNSVASLAAARIRHENTRNIEEPEEEESFMDTSDDHSNIVNYGASTSASADSSERKIVTDSKQFPKWFKPH